MRMKRPVVTLAGRCLIVLVLAGLLQGCKSEPDPGPVAENPGTKPAQPDGTKKPRRKLATVQQRFEQANHLLSDQQFRAAEEELQLLLKVAPQHVPALQLMVLLLNTEGRRWEASHYMYELLQLQQFSIQDLLLLGLLQEPYLDIPTIDSALTRFPDDPLPGIGLIRPLRLSNKEHEARDLLERIVARDPEMIEAQSLLGAILLDNRDEPEFLRWHAALPAAADTHPGIWFTRGIWAERHEQQEAAARAHWETLRREPNHRMANYHLALVLKHLGRQVDADRFLQRSNLIAELDTTMFPIFRDGPDVPRMRRAAEILESLGRLWEAWGWQIAILSTDPSDAAAAQERSRLRQRLDQEKPPLVLAGLNPALAVDLSGYALPDFTALSISAPKESAPPVARVQFVDKATEVGIAFRYFDSWTAAGRELMLLETTGGGAAILDYDNDGWPDIYLTQCCKWPVDLQDFTHLDRLYRNRGDGTFADVTEACGIRENGYSQGVAAGDVDNDGFTDLYVANVGQNRLYHNNGDGTFALVPHHEDSRLIWSSSVLIADLNGDALPDLYDANYVTGEDVFTRHCEIDGRLRSCGPNVFEAELDCLFLNRGDGSWLDVSDTSGIRSHVGRGLGILAADLYHKGYLDIFVANDVMDNFLWVREPDTTGTDIRFTDHGALCGLGCDGTGRPQASMGIACEDVNGNGTLDLLVGNYYNDFCTLYLQEPGNLYSDVTREYNLRDATFLMLTFGCQFLDADLDGQPDLVLANGHIDDFSYRGEPWHMRPQFFRNVAGKHFDELQGADAGPFFERTCLGRGLALVDWNRDGREDFVVSNIADLASLATNLTEPTGNWLRVRLRGVESARDPIGTRVYVEVGARQRTRQLTAGNGYQASNERLLIFPLGTAERADKVTVYWPSGQSQDYYNLPANREVILIEGQATAWQVPVER
jgi:tetratricopeptide (TPR) repeat protein